MRRSKADKLARAYQDKIIAWRMGGDTVDQIRSKLQDEDLPPEALPGRTGMSRYVRKLDQAMEHLLRHRVAAAILGQDFDDAAEAKEARLNIELIGNVVMERLLDMDDEEAAKLSAKEIHEYAKLVDRLARARRTDALTTIALRKEMRTESADAAQTAPAPAAPAAKQASAGADWSDEQILRVQAKIAGVPYETWVEASGYRIVKQDDGTERLERCEDGVAAAASVPDPCDAALAAACGIEPPFPPSRERGGADPFGMIRDNSA